MPQTVTQGGTTKATYGWFTDGSKYSVQDGSGNGYYYIGSLIYSAAAGATALESTDFGEGRITVAGSSQTIHYHHKDHLGSIRAITNGSGTTIEQNAYYPFGGRHTFGQSYVQASANRYKFNGKEEQTTGNLAYLDYGARMYDTQTARWLVQDPLAEKYYPYSPYSFSGNNPVMNIDKDGRDYDVYFITNKKIIAIHAIYLTNKESESSAKRAANIYNNFSDLKYEHKGEEYQVKFHLEVKSSSNPKRTVEGIKDDHNLNSYIYGQPLNNDKKPGFVTTGSTRNKNEIVISQKYEQDLTGAHEMGHTLNLTPEDTHSPEGIMKAHEKDPDRDRFITQENINHMINSARSRWLKIKKR